VKKRIVTRRSDGAQIWVVATAMLRGRPLVLWLPASEMLPGCRFRETLDLNATEATEFEALHLARRRLACGHTIGSTAISVRCNACRGKKYALKTPPCPNGFRYHKWQAHADGEATHRCTKCGLLAKLNKLAQMQSYLHDGEMVKALIRVRRGE